MKTILFLINTYLPGYKAGGPVQSIANLASLLKKSYKVYILCNCHDYNESKDYENIDYDVWRSINGIYIMYLSRGLFPYLSALSEIKSVGFDYIYCNSFYDLKYSIFPSLLYISNVLRVKNRFIIAPRGELTLHAQALKPLKKILFNSLYFKLIRKSSSALHIHSTSAFETAQILSVFPSLPFHNILEAPNIPVVPYQADKISQRPISRSALNIVFVSRLTRKKNLKYALETLMCVSAKCNFHVYGPIEDVEYWNECLHLASQLPSNISFRYCGELPHSLVQRTFNSYDLFFFPTLGENYGHVIFEALSVGCSVLISDQTPWTSSLINDAGWVFSLSSKTSFVRIIDSLRDDISKLYNSSISSLKLSQKLYPKDTSEYTNLFP